MGRIFFWYKEMRPALLLLSVICFSYDAGIWRHAGLSSRVVLDFIGAGGMGMLLIWAVERFK